MKIVTIVGTRPQFIKAAALSRAIAACPETREVMVDTCQHYDPTLSRVFFREMELPKPAYSLHIGSGSHGRQTGRMLEAVESVLLRERPDWVIVYGDTNSTLAGALAAAKLRLPLAHVEAGLRSFNRRMPEEINRVLTDHVSDLLFTPTRTAVGNLGDEGISPKKIRPVGDIMYDVALFYGAKAQKKSRIMKRLSLHPRGYVLATIHRAENTDDPVRLRAVFDGLAEVGRRIPVVLPLHPRTRKCLKAIRLKGPTPGLSLIEPAGYLDMVMLEKNARLIATDSGGIQKEAFFYKVPCVTLRDESEWMELIDLGWNRVVPPRSSRVVSEAVLSGLDRKGKVGRPYGNGHTAERIVSVLRQERR
jgi:UDP-GlcNAc3NAcA epimerase